MREIPERSFRLTKDPAYSVAVGGYESLWETRNKQQLMSNFIAPFKELLVIKRATSKAGTGFYLQTVDWYSLSGQGPIISAKRPVRTRKPEVVVRDG